MLSLTDTLLVVGDNKLSATGQAERGVLVIGNSMLLNLQQLSPKLNGSLRGNGILLGDLTTRNFKLDLVQIKGKVSGYPVQASGLLGMDQNALSARDVQIDVGDNHVTLNVMRRSS